MDRTAPSPTVDATGRVLLVGAVATDQEGDRAMATDAASFARAQLRGRFGLIVLGSDVLDVAEPWQRLIAHNCAAHLVPGGTLAVSVSTEEFEVHAAACGFERAASHPGRTLWRRTDRTTVHDVVAAARDELDRVSAAELAGELAADGDLVVVDVRIPDDRERHGMIAGAVPIARTVLEWRADPTSGYSHEAIASFDQRLVVVCNEGYSSSLAATTLRRLGFARATDLVGGMVAWKAGGHPVVAPGPASDAFTPLEQLGAGAPPDARQ